jgi:hypothetical protein
VNVFVYSGGSTFSGLLDWLFLLLVVFQRRYPLDCWIYPSFEDNDLDSNNAFALLLGRRV